MEQNDFIKLTQHDMLEFEEHLATSLSRFIKFEEHFLYFPKENQSTKPSYIAEENTLILPLWLPRKHGFAGLGVFTLKGVSDFDESLLDKLPGLTVLCLEYMELFKAYCTDEYSGLSTYSVFTQHVSGEISAMQKSFVEKEKSSAKNYANSYGSTFILLSINLESLQKIATEYGQKLAFEFIKDFGVELKKLIPENCIAARDGDYSFTIFIPSENRINSEKLALNIAEEFDKIYKITPLTERKLSARTYIGIAAYPYDLDGVASHDPLDQVQALMQRASLSAKLARDSEVRVLSYNRILYDGIKCVETLPFSRVLVNLGRVAGLSQGQVFSVWQNSAESKSIYKGEVCLIEVREHEAEAEILNLVDPSRLPQAGDNLSLLPYGDSQPDTNLLSHSEFLAKFASLSHEHDKFSLSLLQLFDTDKKNVVENCVKLLRKSFTKEITIGRYGLHSLIVFHPHDNTCEISKIYEKINTKLKSGLAVGISYYPFLALKKSEMVDCVRKSLEYALLLPKPHIGIFDSVALNISADRKHCAGDIFGAIDEYKLSLLADETNALAWNSLGVCMSSLGYNVEARKHFEQSLVLNANDNAIYYNLGNLCLNMGDISAAKHNFETCLSLNPEHLYALIRLGNLEQKQENYEIAKEYYLRAKELDNDNSLVYRQIASICLAQNDTKQAEKFLQGALKHNSQDDIALQMLSKLYLEKDAKLAESLIRHSINLRPNRKNSWLILAKSLELQGKVEQAKQASYKANEY